MEFLLPVRGAEEIEDGAFIKALDYCKKNCFSGQCSSFYQRITKEDYGKFLTCPHGMSVYVAYNDGNPVCFIGMRARGTYQKGKAKLISSQGKVIYNPVMDEKRFEELMETSLSTMRENDLLTEKRAAVDSISHEVKKLNAQIKDRSDSIVQAFNNEPLSESEMREQLEMVKTIYVCSSMINTRFSLLDYEKNPQALSQGGLFECNIYKKFDKMKIIFSNYLGRKVPIVLKGSSYRCIHAYPTFEMIPLLLIDNAVKYSYENNNVVVNFENNDTSLVVTITSYSPFCSKTDLENIYKKGYRGNNAKKVADGSGIGLFFVKMLCDLHKIDISIQSDNSKVVNTSGVDYAPFTVQLCFRDTFDQTH